jgi:hypothetical protein
MRKRMSRSSSTADSTTWDAPDPASEFESEADLLKAATRTAHLAKYRQWALIGGSVVVLVLALSGFLWWGPVADASLRIESDPAGAEVRVDGQLRGTTPLVLTVAPGSYSVVVGQGDAAKERRITVGSAEQASVYQVAVPAPVGGAPVGPASQTAELSVITEPAGGTVAVDDVGRGTAPVKVQGLAAGEHRVIVTNQGSVYRRTVTLQAGVSSTIVIGTSSVSTAGWLTVRAPLTLEIREGGRLLGTSQADRLMLPAGEHQLEFSDPRVGFRVTRAVRIVPEETVSVALPIPRAPVNVNATPWAEVWIDGERVGETPIANYMLPLGEQQVELRHPELGTKRVAMLVSANGANRLAVNMRER